MKLSHFASRRTSLRSLVRPASIGRSAFKPRNCLWLSCGDAWIDWLRDEGMAKWLDRTKYRYDTVVSRASLIVLATIADVDAITRLFGRRHDNKHDGTTVVAIDWDAVRISMPTKAGVMMTDRTNKAVKRRCNAEYAATSELSDIAWASQFDVCSCAIWDPAALDGWDASPYVKM